MGEFQSTAPNRQLKDVSERDCGIKIHRVDQGIEAMVQSHVLSILGRLLTS